MPEIDEETASAIQRLTTRWVPRLTYYRELQLVADIQLLLNELEKLQDQITRLEEEVVHLTEG